MGLLNWIEKRIDLSSVEDASTIEKQIKERLSIKALAYHVGTSYIIDTLSKCEIKHFVNGKEVKDKWYYLLNVSPNVNQNAFELKTKFIYKALYDNEALMFEYRGNLYVADSFSREEKPLTGDLFTNITLLNESRTFKRKADDCFYLNFKDANLKQLVDSMLNDYEEILKYSVSSYKDGNSSKYKFEIDGIKRGNEEENRQFQESLKSSLKTFMENNNSVFIQHKGTNLSKFETSNKTDSSDIRELTKEIFEATAKAFKMPISMLYGNMTNAKDIIGSFITFAIEPKAKIIEEELTRKTGTYEDYQKKTYFNIDTSCIMHQDIFEVADKVDKLISSGIYCIDELREKLKESPLNTEFSKQHWMTRNYANIEEVLNGELEKGGEQ